MHAGSTAPYGYGMCDGGAISRTTYANLFGEIGTFYGAGDGSTTFNKPNIKGVTVFGYDSSQSEFNALGKRGGEKVHALTPSEIASHGHNVYGRYGTDNPATSATEFGLPLMSASSGERNYNTNTIRGSGANGVAHNTLPPYVVLNYIIKY